MDILYILIGVALAVAVGFLWAFGWAVRSGQYDDTEGPAMRMLHDDEAKRPQAKGKAQDDADINDERPA